MFAMFVPGILELVFVVCMLGLPLLVVAIVLFIQHRRDSNLHPCPDCRHYFSVQATHCPQCGAPVKGV